MKIFLNSEQINIKENSKICDIAKNDSIALKNGKTLPQNYNLVENDKITIAKKSCFPSKKIYYDYLNSRQPDDYQEKIANGKIAVFGLGGLGSNIAIMLARLGVGTLKIVDFDNVDFTNLNRQSYFLDNIGKPKTLALENQLQKINPYISIETYNEFVTEENACVIAQNFDIAIEAFDDPKSKAMLATTLLANNKTIKLVSASGMAGYDTANSITTKKINNRFFVCGDKTSKIETQNDLIATRVMVCASHQAHLALRLLLDLEE